MAKKTLEEAQMPSGKMKWKGKDAVILAHGESGNAHAFYGEDTVELIDDEKLIVKGKDSLAHEEHGHHIVEPLSPTQPAIGDVTIKVEYSPRPRRVID